MVRSNGLVWRLCVFLFPDFDGHVCVWVLTEQLKELKQEFMKQEEQIREVKKNSTTLERKLEYERFVDSCLSFFMMA